MMRRTAGLRWGHRALNAADMLLGDARAAGQFGLGPATRLAQRVDDVAE